MTLPEAYSILEHHRKWMKGDSIEPPNPSYFWEAIDTILAAKDKYVHAANEVGQEMLLNRKDYMNSNSIAQLVNDKFDQL